MTLFRITMEQIDKIGGNPEGKPGSRHTIFEGGYDSGEDTDILQNVEMQLNDWEEEIAKEIILEEIQGKLARLVGRVIEGERFHMTDRDSVVYDPEDESASWRIRGDDEEAIVTVRLG